MLSDSCQSGALPVTLDLVQALEAGRSLEAGRVDRLAGLALVPEARSHVSPVGGGDCRTPAGMRAGACSWSWSLPRSTEQATDEAIALGLRFESAHAASTAAGSGATSS
jgi:hypothetical protein